MRLVGIVFIQDIRYCPYLSRYTDALRRAGVPFDLIWWERWEKAPDTPLPAAADGAQEYHVFRKASEMARNPAYKIADFAAFSSYARRIIRRKKYDRLIILTTMTAILLSDLLLGAYRGRYIFDIRDYSYERFGLFKSLEGKLVDASDFTCISSEGFKQFLPEKRDYVLVDNFAFSDIRAAEGCRFKKKPEGEPIDLSYIGFIRYFDENRKLLDRLLGDSRFRLSYHGMGADYPRLLEYQKAHPESQLDVTGYFDFEKDKPALCVQADIINNFYPHTLEIQRLATTNKTYDAIIYRRPQLVSKHTFSEDLVKNWNIGCALDIDQADFADRLYDYYHSLDEDQFNLNADAALQEILARDRAYGEKIDSFIRYGNSR